MNGPARRTATGPAGSYALRMGIIGTVITAIVTPFKADGSIDEDAFVELMKHLHANGSDGIAVAGTTGEASTMADEEHLRVIELAVGERPEGLRVIAGTGSNDTRHACELTERATELGIDAALVVNPYYNRPPRRGIIAHYEEVGRATDRPIVLYNIPQRTGSDMPNDLLAELGQRIENVVAVKQANNDNLAPVEGLELYAGNDDIFARVLDLGGSGGILTASHVAGPEFRRMVDEPENRAAIHDSLHPLFEALAILPAAASNKAALKLLGLPGGHVRLPYVDADESETATLREALTAHGLIGPVA